MEFPGAVVPIALVAALLPAAILSAFFSWRFRRYISRELIADAFCLGIISAMFAAGFGVLGGWLISQIEFAVWRSLGDAFITAAIPEELAKFIVIWTILRRHEDCEWPESIFAVAIVVSLGFAAIENVLYVFEDKDRWLHTGISRAMTAVPLHTVCGIVMGRFLAKGHVAGTQHRGLLLLGVLLTIILHGAYDWPLFYMDYVEEVMAQTSGENLVGNLGPVAAVALAAIVALAMAPNDIQPAFSYHRGSAASPGEGRRAAKLISYGFTLAGMVLTVVGLTASILPVVGEALDLIPHVKASVFGFLPLAFGMIILRGIKNEADTARAISAS